MWDGSGNAFKGSLSFVLKVCEEELTKWTTGEAGQSILMQPQLGIPGKQGVPGDLQSLHCQWLEETLTVLLPGSMGLFDHCCHS